MGTLKKLNIIGSETAEQNSRVAYREQTVSAIRTGEVLLFGLPIASPGGPIPLGVGLTQPILEMAAQGLEDYPTDFENQTADVMIEGYKLIDNIPDSNVLQPFGLKDWTFTLLPLVNFILELLALLKVPDPPAWLMEKLPEIIKKSEEFGEAMTELATECKSGKLAKLIVSLDPELKEEVLKGELDKPVGNTGKRLCELIPTLELPKFSLPPLPVPFIQPWTWKAFSPPFFPIPPASIPMPLFNPTWPSIGWSPELPTWNHTFDLTIIPIILECIQKIIDAVAELAKIIIEGVVAVIKWLIEFMIKNIVMPIVAALSEMLKKFVTFAAAIAVFLKNILAALVVSIIGLLLGAGLFSWGAAYTLGLLPE